MVSLRSDLRQRGRGIMTVGARLRSKAESSLLRRGSRGRGRTERDEEAAAILEHLEYADEAEAAAESGASAAVERGPGARGARRVHFAHLPERYELLEEPAPSEQPKKRYRRKLKKYGKVGALRRHCPEGAGVVPRGGAGAGSSPSTHPVSPGYTCDPLRPRSHSLAGGEPRVASRDRNLNRRLGWVVPSVPAIALLAA